LEHELLVKKTEYTRVFTVLNQVYRVLVILELYILPHNVLLDVFFLLYVEHLLIKHLLQLFVRVVDAELLKRV
jgi:hypothetical protein